MRRNDNNLAGLLQAAVAGFDHSSNGYVNNCHFNLARRNATLQQIFFHIATFFPEARILTLEGGNGKKPHVIQHFDVNSPYPQHLEVLPNIHSFFMKGAWNIIRGYQDWCHLAHALPNIVEWDCAYAEPKLEAQMTVAKILSQLPSALTRLNISMEAFCHKLGPLPRWNNMPLGEDHHICRLLGRAFPQLESVSFTGKVCAYVFVSARNAMVKRGPSSRLKSVDIVVTACCRDTRGIENPLIPSDMTGVTNMNFINAFEKLVLATVFSLDVLPGLRHIRIRYIDLDSHCGVTSPYFEMVDNVCTGLWSERIVEALYRTRPNAHFERLSDGILSHLLLNGRCLPVSRPKSIKSSSYEMIADKTKQ